MRQHASSIASWAVVLALAPFTAHAETYFGFQLGITKAPPPPEIVFYEEPTVVVVPATRVSRVKDASFDADLFRFGGTWYAYAGRYWYRADDVRGPYRLLDVRHVPRAVLFVPPMHWKHHPQGGPPGLAKKQTMTAAKKPPQNSARRGR